ncbi:Protein LIN1 [Spathaspora sp. JA1]|nr:Protein LIN1 [Spathaspora sp. JA1]
MNDNEGNIAELEEQEVILGNSRKYKERHRNDIRLNYDSDSSEEEDEDEVAESKEHEDGMFTEEEEETNGIQEEEEDDMFSDDEPALKKPKSVQFDESPQEFEDSDRDAESLEEEDDDEENQTVPKIEAFNLEEESNEGQFDEDGTYIPNKEEEITGDDLWLNDFKKSDIKKAQLAQTRREKQAAEKLMTKNINMEPIETLLVNLIELLEPAETPLEALARLNTKSKKKKLAPQENQQNIIEITDLCDILINDKYLTDTYELTREELMRKYRVETGEDYKRGTKRSHESDDEEEDYGEKIWEFRWEGDTNVNGPYSTYEMKHWKESYFENRAEVRKVGQEDFQHITMIDFQEE